MESNIITGITVHVCPSVPILSGHLLNLSTFCNQTWHGGASSRTGRDVISFIAIFKVKVTVRAYISEC